MPLSPQTVEAPTPRADAFVAANPAETAHSVRGVISLYADFARQLERENSELFAALEQAGTVCSDNLRTPDADCRMALEFVSQIIARARGTA